MAVDAAAKTAIEAIDKISDTSYSHKRTFVVEVMGRHAGDIAVWAGLATGADQVIIPEEDFDIKEVVRRNMDGYENRGKSHAIIVLAEGVTNAENFVAIGMPIINKKAIAKSSLIITCCKHVPIGGHQLA